MRLCVAGPPNGQLDLPGGWYARREYQTLAIGRGGGSALPPPFPVPPALSGRPAGGAGRGARCLAPRAGG